VRVRCTTTYEGPGPSEAVVAVRTTDGKHEELIVDRSAVTDNTIKVGRVHQEGQSVLVELPRESATGNWRIWVSSEETSP